MKVQATSLFILFALVGVRSVIPFHYINPAYSDLLGKLDKLENKIKTAQMPIIVPGHEENGDGPPPQEQSGTHVYIHVSLDDRDERSPDEDYSYASCFVQPNSVKTSNHSVHGFVYLRQKPSSQLEMKIEFRGFLSPGKYGFHVHENPSFQHGCNSFGGHLNPYGSNHGGPLDEERHLGDWGNVEVDSSLTVSETRTDKMASLFGPDPIIGHGIDVHSGEDDLGRGGNAKSLRSGNAGPRIACCVVGWTNGGPW